MNATNGQQPGPTWEEIEPLVAGFLVTCELGDRLRDRLEANLDAAQMALEAARAEPWVEGSTGQTKAHPGFAIANACDSMALALYREVTRGVDELIPELAKSLRSNGHHPGGRS
jgi:hypothetical protein